MLFKFIAVTVLASLVQAEWGYYPFEELSLTGLKDDKQVSSSNLTVFRPFSNPLQSSSASKAFETRYDNHVASVTARADNTLVGIELVKWQITATGLPAIATATDTTSIFTTKPPW
jgi:hypothetical protein